MLTEGSDCFRGLVAEPARVAAIDPVKREIERVAQFVRVTHADEALTVLVLIVCRGIEPGLLRKFLLLEPPNAPRQSQALAYPFRRPVCLSLGFRHRAPLITWLGRQSHFHMRKPKPR